MVKTAQAPARPDEPGPREGRSAAGRIVRAIGIIGRVLVVAGLLLLFYTTYLLWGTSLQTSQAQEGLRNQLAENPIVTDQQVQTGDIPPARPAEEPEIGEGLFTMRIPKIGLEHVVVQGVEREELKKGPGHFPDAPYPGESGNVAISGHRTTYGAPFYRLNELEAGDEIVFESGPARYTYRVREQKIVAPTAVEVVEDHGRDELTLTTCHPRFSAAQRLIVHADYEGATLVGGAVPSPSPSTGAGAEREAGTEAEAESELVPESDPIVPMDVVALGSIAVAAAIAAMALSDRLRKVAIYATVALGSAAGLWVVVFPQILQLMPANY